MQDEDLGDRLRLAIKASGKSRAEIAEEAETTEETLSRIVNGRVVNVSRDLLERIASAAGTTAAYLLGGTSPLSPDDREVLLRFRDWIDDKLPKIDARAEPNAVLVASAVSDLHTADMIADRNVVSLDVPAAFARRDVQHVLHASGDSMTGAGIMNGDTLYAITPPQEPPVGTVIACRLRGEIYVKRVATEHGRLLLLSANPQYVAIRVDQESDDFEMIGIVIGRAGAVE